MKETIRSLERKLNKIIDDELQKDVSQIDDRIYDYRGQKE